MDWTAAGRIRHWTADRPEQPMLTGVDTGLREVTRTWRQVDDRSSQVANALLAEGVGPADRVAFLDKNCIAYFETLFGAAKINAVDVAVNWRLAAPEIAQVINDAEAKVLIVGREFVPQLEAFEDQLTTVRRIIVVEGGHEKHPAFDDWLGAQPTTDPGASPAPDDVTLQMYTSGTTGLPKGAMLTNRNMAGVTRLAAELDLESDAVNLAAMPLFHIGGSGWALVGLSQGAHTVLCREVDPAAILDTLERFRVTHAFLVPAVLQFMLAVPGAADRDLSALRSILYGASPISDDVLRRCLTTFGCDFVQVYGLTETTGAITVLRAEDHDPDGPHPERLRSCGVPFAHVELRIVDPDSGGDQPVGVVGELWTRSEQNMAGYYRKPQETAATLGTDGWLRTGDAGYLDADGFVYLHDRIKDMIVSGGENVYPAEVENVLMSHPEVADAAVIGVPDERWGETVKAIVVPAGEQRDAAAIISYCRDRLAHYKCPTSVDFIEALPRNPSGKILKRELRAPYWRDRERNIS